MSVIDKIVVYTECDPEKNSIVISYARKGENLYKTTAQCINLSDGCNCNKDFYLRWNYTVISYEEFERDYLNKSIEYECY